MFDIQEFLQIKTRKVGNVDLAKYTQSVPFFFLFKYKYLKISLSEYPIIFCTNGTEIIK